MKIKKQKAANNNTKERLFVITSCFESGEIKTTIVAKTTIEQNI